jgi:CTD kinase subunit gamma
MDSFEIRLQFYDILQKLKLQDNSIHRACTFALENRGSSEAIYNCWLEVITNAKTTQSLLLFYLIDAICLASTKAKANEYKDLVLRDLRSILDKVTSCPGGSINIPNVLKVLKSWQDKHIFENKVAIADEEKRLSSIEVKVDSDLSRNDIMRRIEEDRERHKKDKEELWLRLRKNGSRSEFEYVWDRVK